MANNPENLRSLAELSTEEVRKIAQKGGINSGIARRQKRDYKTASEILLNVLRKDARLTENQKQKLAAMGFGTTNRDTLLAGIYDIALSGTAQNKMKAVDMIFEYTDEKPKQELTETPTPILNINVVDNSKIIEGESNEK